MLKEMGEYFWQLLGAFVLSHIKCSARGGVAGCWAVLEALAVELCREGQEVFQQSSGVFPSQHTLLGSQEGSGAVLSFYLLEQDTTSCPPTASAPRIAGIDFIQIFSHPPSPFHLLTAGVRGKETKEELPGLW